MNRTQQPLEESHSHRFLELVLLSAALLLAGCASATQTRADTLPSSPVHGQPSPSAAVPTVAPLSGPVPPGAPDGAGIRSVTRKVLDAYGYQVKEYVISGTADAYTFSEPPKTDGLWRIAVDPGSDKAYKTRMVVYTPKDPQRFSGNVHLEWANVTIGNDVLPDLIFDHTNPFRVGDAYVGVSAQFVGVASAKLNDPERYSALLHPGDSYSYDIFSQAGMAVRGDPQVLNGLQLRTLIADGESQSAGRLVTYINAFAPLFNVYDGYLVHSRAAGAFPLQQPPGTAMITNLPSGEPVSVPDGNAGRSAQNTPEIVKSRTDLLAPVLYFQSQTDVYGPPNGILAYGPATQPSSAGFRLWEVAGTAHVDDYVANQGADDTGDVANAVSRFNAMLNPPKSQSGLGGSVCDRPINTGQQGYVLGAARQQLTRWVRTGGANGGQAATAPPLFAGQTVGEGPATVPQFDAQGNILGGVRSSAVDVPVATLTGAPNIPMFCALSGMTKPLPKETLKKLYPTREVFVQKWTAAVNRLADEGYLTGPDAKNLLAAVRAASLPF